MCEDNSRTKCQQIPIVTILSQHYTNVIAERLSVRLIIVQAWRALVGP